MEDLLRNNKTCPEETLFQIGTIEESVSPEVLLQVVNEFFGEFERRFGTHVHILNWALHLDEGTPHIHERHVFDCENRYGELCPQQKKALEKLDIPLPQPDKPKDRNNNRKQMFDSICRALLFEVAKRHGLHLEEEPSYGGRVYLEKQDFILMKQKEKMQEQEAVLRKQEEQIKDNTGQIEEQKDRISGQEAKIERLEIKLGDLDSLLEDVSNIAYETAVEIVTDRVQMETHQEDIRQIEGTISWLESPERKAPKKERDYAIARLKGVISKIQKTMQPVLERIRERLMKSETKRQAAEYYGIRVRRNGMCCCPSHDDKHPSMKVDRRFHCFGCQEDGDVIDFTAKLFGLSVKDAAMKLAVDFGVSYDARGYNLPVKKSVNLKISDERRQAMQKCFRVYAEYLHFLKDWKNRYAPNMEDADWHLLFMEALQKQNYVEYLLDTLLTGTEEEREAAVAGTRKKVAVLERRLSGFKDREQSDSNHGSGSCELAG